MTGSDGIHTHALYDLKLPLGRASIDRRAKRTQVVVITNAVKLHNSPVQQETLFAAIFDGANAELRDVPIEHVAAGSDSRDGLIQVWVRHIPALRMGDVQALRGCFVLVRCDCKTSAI